MGVKMYSSLKAITSRGTERKADSQKANISKDGLTDWQQNTDHHILSMISHASQKGALAHYPGMSFPEPDSSGWQLKPEKLLHHSTTDAQKSEYYSSLRRREITMYMKKNLTKNLKYKNNQANYWNFFLSKNVEAGGEKCSNMYMQFTVSKATLPPPPPIPATACKILTHCLYDLQFVCFFL